MVNSTEARVTKVVYHRQWQNDLVVNRLTQAEEVTEDHAEAAHWLLWNAYSYRFLTPGGLVKKDDLRAYFGLPNKTSFKKRLESMRQSIKEKESAYSFIECDLLGVAWAGLLKASPSYRRLPTGDHERSSNCYIDELTLDPLARHEGNARALLHSELLPAVGGFGDHRRIVCDVIMNNPAFAARLMDLGIEEARVLDETFKLGPGLPLTRYETVPGVTIAGVRQRLEAPGENSWLREPEVIRA